jgi:hypothetical protein
MKLICVFQKRTDSEISDNPHTSKTSVNIIEIQKKETDMSKSDPPSALITVSEYDDDDDSLFNSEIDADGVIGKAIHSMEIIKSEQNQRTTDGFVTSKFRTSAFLLLEILSYIIEQKSCEEKTDMLQRLTKHSIEYQTINIYCKVCVEKLETSDKSPKSVIPLEHLEAISIVLSFLVNSSDDNSEMCSAISEQPHFLEVLTKRLVDWTEPHSNQTLDQVYS